MWARLKRVSGWRAGDMDDKVKRRLAQNREAARKSRQRRKAYVQNLEEEVRPDPFHSCQSYPIILLWMALAAGMHCCHPIMTHV